MEFDTTDLQLQYLYGDACMQIRAYVLAEEAFKYVVENDEDQSHPLAPFMLGAAQQRLGKYDDALENLGIYLPENSGDDAYYTA